MKAILNEVSIPDQYTLPDIKRYIDSLVMGFKFLFERKIGKDQLKLHLTQDFGDNDFGAQFYNILYSEYEWETASLITSIVDCISLEEIIAIHDDAQQLYTHVSIDFENSDTPGKGFKAIAYKINELSYLFSFISHQRWGTSKIELKAFKPNEQFSKFESLNFSNVNSGENDNFKYEIISKYLTQTNWSPKNNPFPFADLAKKEFRAICDKEIAECKRQEDRIPIYQKYGRCFCKTNGYKFDDAISSINSNNSQLRDIYYAGTGNRMRFISIDVENGGFEFCDNNGTHLGTFGWAGDEIGIAKPYTHSINLRR